MCLKVCMHICDVYRSVFICMYLYVSIQKKKCKTYMWLLMPPGEVDGEGDTQGGERLEGK